MNFTLDETVSQNLREFSKQNKITVFALLLSAYICLLYRYTNQDDIVVGTPVSLRKYQNCVGFFLNTVAMRFSPVSTDLVLDHAKKVFRTMTEFLENSDIPFDQVVDAIHPARETSFHVLFQTMFVYTIRNPPNDKEIGPFSIEHLPVENNTSKFDLTVQIEDFTNSKMHVVMEFSSFFEPSLQESITNDLKCFLSRCVESSNMQITNHNLWQTGGSDQFLSEVPGDFPEGLQLHMPFYQQVKKHAEKEAIIAPMGITVTYKRLFETSNKIGRWIRKQGISPNTLVGIIMDHGWEQTVACVSILAAGAAFIPIDSNIPEERMKFIVSTSDLKIVLTQSWLQSKIDTLATYGISLTALHVDLESEFVEFSADEIPPLEISGKLAYVIFTSGSTGTPKGVMIDHRGALNTIFDINERFHVTHDDSVLAVSALTFDLSIYDIFGMLAVGGTIVYPSRNPSLRWNPKEWAELILKHKISIWNSVPTLAGMLFDFVISENVGRNSSGHYLPSIRIVMMSGDWIPVKLAKTLLTQTCAKVYSLGGATEGSIWSILFPITEISDSWKSIPYGPVNAMKNQWIHVLDSEFRPCPTWVAGQLCIRGLGVALGYWKDAIKTIGSYKTIGKNVPAEYVHDHVINNDDNRLGSRLYLTGDLGRLLPSGQIEFLGRLDHQMKLRGLRIEAGEIQTIINNFYDYISESIVAIQSSGDNQVLVAYVVLNNSQATSDFSVSRLNQYLISKLPRYMVPTHYSVLPSLPKSDNGKIDRKRLPWPISEANSKESSVASDVSRNTVASTIDLVQSIVMGIIASVLEVKNILLSDSFFDIGGNSLAAIRASWRISESLKIEVTSSVVFQNPKLADLCAAVLDCWSKGKEMQKHIRPIITEALGSTHKTVLSYEQKQMLTVGYSNSGLYNISQAMAFLPDTTGHPVIKKEILEKCLLLLCQKHEVLHTKFFLTKEGFQGESVDSHHLTVELQVCIKILLVTIFIRSILNKMNHYYKKYY